MRRMRVVALTGCLLVAGGAGTGTASAGQPEERATRASTVVEQVRPGGPDLPAPGPRSVEPDGRRPGSIPHLVQQGPGPVPIPRVRPARPRPAPMPRLLTERDQLVPLDELLPPRQ